MGNDLYIWEMAQVFEKRLNSVGNDLDLWTKYLGNGLDTWDTALVF